MNEIKNGTETEFCIITDNSCLKPECVKMFLRKFYSQDPNFKWKFEVVLELSPRKNDRNIPSS